MAKSTVKISSADHLALRRLVVSRLQQLDLDVSKYNEYLEQQEKDREALASEVKWWKFGFDVPANYGPDLSMIRAFSHMSVCTKQKRLKNILLSLDIFPSAEIVLDEELLSEIFKNDESH